MQIISVTICLEGRRFVAIRREKKKEGGGRAEEEEEEEEEEEGEDEDKKMEEFVTNQGIIEVGEHEVHKCSKYYAA